MAIGGSTAQVSRHVSTTSRTVSDSDIVALAYVAGWRGDDIVTATAVCLAESDGNIYAIDHDSDGSTDYGLWQVNSIHFDETGWDTTNWIPSQLYVPTNNAAAAYHVWQGSGWAAWSTYTSGAYQTYLTRANAAYKGSTAQQAQTYAQQANANFTIAGISTGIPLTHGVVHDVAEGANDAYNAATSVPKFLGLLTQTSTWILILKVVAGFLLIGFGFKWLVDSSGK